jgi:hypothetical protein
MRERFRTTDSILKASELVKDDPAEIGEFRRNHPGIGTRDVNAGVTLPATAMRVKTVYPLLPSKVDVNQELHSAAPRG